MVTSEIIKLNFTNDNEEIERELKTRGIDPLRWAIVAVEAEQILISVSYVK